MMRKYFVLPLVAGLLLTTSCRQDEVVAGVQSPTPREHVALGESVALSLSGGTDELRAMTFTTAEGFPKLKPLARGSKVSVVCVFRKQGDPASLTYKTLQWTVDETGRRISYQGTLTLAEGEMRKQDNGKWYMMAIVGGRAENIDTAEASSKARVAFTTIQPKATPQDEIELEVPYVLPWTALEVSRDAYAEHKQLQFKPQGSLLRVEVRNGMVAPYELTKLYVSTNAFTTAGAFDLTGISDEMLTSGATPVWQSEEPQAEIGTATQPFAGVSTRGFASVPLWVHQDLTAREEVASRKRSYITYELAQPQTIASGAVGTTLYTWVMPRPQETNGGADATPVSTYMYADVREQGQTGAVQAEAIPVFRSSLTPVAGQIHRLYPEISSELIIRQAYAHYIDTDASPTRAFGPPAFWGPSFGPIGPGGGSGAGGVGPGNPPQTNLSALVLYNPTLYPIDLLDYGLLRGGYFKDVDYKDKQKHIQLFDNDKSETVGDLHPSGIVLPLRALLADHQPFATGAFASWHEGLRGNYEAESEGEPFDINKRFRLVAGERPSLQGGQLLLQPGKCAVLLAGGWLDDDTSDWEEPLKQSIETAVAKGYCQFAVAYSDAPRIYGGFSVDSYHRQGAGTLDLGVGQGFVLLRHHTSQTGQSAYRVVSSSVPFRNAYASHQTVFEADLQHFFDRSSTPSGNIDASRTYLYKRQPSAKHTYVHPVQFPSERTNYRMQWTISAEADLSQVYKGLCTPNGEDIDGVSTLPPPVAPSWAVGKSRWVER